MPYASQDDQPANIKELPKKLQRMWLKVWNSVFEQTNDEGKAFAAANAAVRDAQEKGAMARIDEGPWELEIDGDDVVIKPIVPEGSLLEHDIVRVKLVGTATELVPFDAADAEIRRRRRPPRNRARSVRCWR